MTAPEEPRCARCQFVDEQVRLASNLAGEDPLAAFAPEGNDYRTGYKDGLLWLVHRIQHFVPPRRTEGKE